MADTIEVSTRQFSRKFAEMKKLALSGAKLRIRDGSSIFRFEMIENKAGFLGCAKGTLQSQAKPELLFSTGESWQAERKG
jgi:hypothetical protein